MSKKLNSSLNKNNSSNSLLNYFARSPVIRKEKETISKENEKQENPDTKENDDATEVMESPKLPANEKLLKSANGAAVGSIKVRNFNDMLKQQQVEQDVEMPETDQQETKSKSMRKFKRIFIASSDEEDAQQKIGSSNDEKDVAAAEKSTKTKKRKLQAEDSGAKFLEKLEECKRNMQPDNAEKQLEQLDKKQVKEEAAEFQDVQIWPHQKLEFLQPHKIKDIKGRRPDHAEYDKTTLYVPPKFLDTLSPAVRQWWIMKSQHFDCVLFFKVGKFYELYHMDADVGVKELGFTYMRGEFAHSGFPEISFDKMASILVDRGYKVARVEQTETVDMMTQRCKTGPSSKFDKVVRREICQISNRGTRIFGSQCEIALDHELNYMLAVVEQPQQHNTSSRFGITFIDTTIGEFCLGEFDDDSNCSRLLTLLSHHMPVLVLTERGSSLTCLKHVLKTMLSDVLKEELAPNASAEKTLRYLSEKYFGADETKTTWPAELLELIADAGHLNLTPKPTAKLCLKALGLCINYLQHMQIEPFVMPTARYKLYSPPDVKQQEQRENAAIKQMPAYMVLDSITLSNLHIIGKGEKHTLLSTLDTCCTKFGKRKLHHWLCAPSCNLNVIKSRQKVIETFLKDDNLLQALRGLFANLPDFERNLTQLQLFGSKHIKQEQHPDSRAILFEETVYNKKKIKAFIGTIKSFDAISQELPKLFNKEHTNNAPLLQQYVCLPKDGGKFPDLTEKLEYFQTGFDHEKAASKGVIEPKPGADKEYDETLEKIQFVEQELKSYLKEQEKFFGCTLHYVGADKKRYQLEIPDKNSHKAGKQYSLEGQRKGFKRYTTDRSKKLLKDMIHAEEARDSVLRDISRRIFDKFAQHYNIWKQAVECVANLDVLAALAMYARAQHTICAPDIQPVQDGVKPAICIEDGYHPCIDIDDYIPNGIELGTENAAPLCILTGANMGGKSTLMRQLGLLVVMSQIGSYVPAKSFRSTLVDRVFTRLGAQDDILAGHSTFLVELNETSFILKHASAYSLVLMDELGRGTGSYDGFAIATSVVNFLGELGCRSIFSTHYHNLLNFFKDDARIHLGHMACLVENEDSENPTEENVTFLYKYANGACPKSYGFHTAKLAGAPSNIIQRAYNLARQFKANAMKRKIAENVAKFAINGDVDLQAIQKLFAKVKN